MTIEEFFERPDVQAGVDPGSAVVDYGAFEGERAEYEVVEAVGGTAVLDAFERRLAAEGLRLAEEPGEGYVVEPR